MATAPPAPGENHSGGVPWHVWCCVVAVTSAMVGVQWDISWHRSIGRDTFWTPAHVAIYLCGVLAGIASGYLILSTTFRRTSPLRETSVTMWGFRGPMGAFIAAWGGIAMLVSAPFDDWWHNAYGLDVKIISPPHALLFLGNGAIQMGGLILILGYMNRAEGALRRRWNWVFLYAGAMFLCGACVFIMSYSFPNYMHSGLFYRVVGTAVPFLLVGIGTASHQRWAYTKMTAIFTLFWLGCMWVLPLFPAEPKLGPVYQKVTQFVPPPFPLLVVVPAFFLDLLRPKLTPAHRWIQAAVLGAVFIAVLVAVQWPLGSFLLSDTAHNALFGQQVIDYNTHPNSNLARRLFSPVEKTASEFWTNLLLAFVAAGVMSRLGLGWGESMRRVRR